MRSPQANRRAGTLRIRAAGAAVRCRSPPRTESSTTSVRAWRLQHRRRYRRDTVLIVDGTLVRPRVTIRSPSSRRTTGIPPIIRWSSMRTPVWSSRSSSPSRATATTAGYGRSPVPKRRSEGPSLSPTAATAAPVWSRRGSPCDPRGRTPQQVPSSAAVSAGQLGSGGITCRDASTQLVDVSTRKTPPCPAFPQFRGVIRAVAVGFEPTEELPPHALSRRAPSAARTRYRGRA